MPQPLDRVKKINTMSGGPGVILQRPELASLVVAVITSWSHTEVALGRFLAICLRGDSSAGLAMYLSLSGAGARQAALHAAAEKSLDGEKLQLFKTVMKAIKPVRDRRNDFAHGLWAISKDLPDDLLWVKSDDELENFESVLKAAQQGTIPIMVYRKADLERDFEDAKQAASCAHCIGVLANPLDSHVHSGLLEHLRTRPLFRKIANG